MNYSTAEPPSVQDLTLGLATISKSSVGVTLTAPYTPHPLMYTMMVKAGVDPPAYIPVVDNGEATSASAQGPLRDQEEEEEEDAEEVGGGRGVEEGDVDEGARGKCWRREGVFPEGGFGVQCIRGPDRSEQHRHAGDQDWSQYGQHC